MRTIAATVPGLWILAVVSTAPELQAAGPPAVTVFAAASTAAPMTEVAALHEAEGKGKARLVFASSGVLARQIANGAPADVFVSANRLWMDWLVARGLIVGTPVPLFGNRLVLVQPADSDESFALDATLAERLGNGRLAIGDPDHVPAGIYAKEALDWLGLWQDLENAVVLMPDVRSALLLVERGEAAAGIVYASDAALTGNVRVAATFPAGSHAPIVYPAGAVADRRTAGGLDFLDFLQRPAAQAIFHRYGFSVD